MKDSIRFFKLAIVNGFVCLILFLCANSQADDSLSPPQQVIQKTSDELQSTLQTAEMRNNVEKAREFVQTVLEPHTDFGRFSALVLGKHWKKASADQKSRFKKEFKGLLVRTYATAFTEYSDWEIRYLPLRTNSDDKKVVVKTEVLQPGAAPVSISYRMINKKGEWKVYDIIIEGISLIKNYRTSINNDIKSTGSLDSVIDKLAARKIKPSNAVKSGS